MKLQIEKWKNIPNYSRYLISNMGRIKIIKTGNIMIPKLIGPYYFTRLVDDSDNKRNAHAVHILVANAFVQNDNSSVKFSVEHRNNDKLDNCASNLVWVIQLGDMHNRLDNEIWKTLTGHSKYEISNMGRVRVKKSGIIRKPGYNGSYFCLVLKDDDKKMIGHQIHRLVAIHFIKNDSPTIKIKVDHVNNNKLDNRACNLSWVTQQQNMQNYVDNFKIYINKPIVQYDLNYKKIKIWNDANDIIEANPSYRRPHIVKNLKEYNKAYGFYWKYKYKYEAEQVKFKNDEIFKRIGQFDNFDLSNYAVSNYGNIMNIKKERMLLQRINNDYYVLALNSSGKEKMFRIHRLVAFVFINGRTMEKDYVNHLNKNKLDNRDINLEWTTRKENSIHAIARKVQQIDPGTNKILRTFNSIAEATNHFGKNSSRISLCCTGVAKICLGYKWKYV